MVDDISIKPIDTAFAVATDAIENAAGTEEHFQRVKISVGPDGKATDATLLDPLPMGDYRARDLLTELVVQMKIMNLHLEIVTDQKFSDGDT